MVGRPLSLVNLQPYLRISKVFFSFTDIHSMGTKKPSDLKKAIAEKHKQYLALQYEIFKYEQKGEPPPKELIKQVLKIKFSPEFVRAKRRLN